MALLYCSDHRRFPYRCAYHWSDNQEIPCRQKPCSIWARRTEDNGSRHIPLQPGISQVPVLFGSILLKGRYKRSDPWRGAKRFFMFWSCLPLANVGILICCFCAGDRNFNLLADNEYNERLMKAYFMGGGAQQAGLNSEEDVVRMIKELRQESVVK